MGLEYKRLEFKDNKKGQKNLEKELNKLGSEGWRVVDSENQKGKISVTRAVGLGVIFLPLALKSRKKGKINILLEREV